MKERRFYLVLLVIVLAFGMTFVGCNNDDGGTAFDGTWKTDAEGGMIIVAKGGSLTVYNSDDDSPFIRGTYTVSGKDVAITFTQRNTGSGWETYPDDPQDGPPKNVSGTINGNQFTVTGLDMIFTKV